MLTLPSFITRSGVDKPPVDYEWDSEDPEDAYLSHDEKLGRAINACAEKAVLALSLGFCEWIAYRLHRQHESQLLCQFIEASWAGMIDWRYMAAYEIPDPEDWQGPERGPLWAAFDLLDDIVELVSTSQFSYPESVALSKLAEHILHDPTPFTKWRRFAIERLMVTHPATPENMLGPPVPSQAIDPDVEYTESARKEFLANFVDTLDYTKNPYLASPHQMQDAGFEGVPYPHINVTS